MRRVHLIQSKGIAERFFDGCHRYGWIINILMTAIMLGAAWGSMRTKVDDLAIRMIRVEDILIGQHEARK